MTTSARSQAALVGRIPVPRHGLWMVLGALTGALAVLWSPGPVAVLWLAYALWLGIGRIARSPEEVRWLRRWLTAGFVLRALCAVAAMGLSWAYGVGSDVFGDARAYNYSGNYIAEVLRGEPLQARYTGNDEIGLHYLRGINRGRIPPMEQYQIGMMAYLVGWLYAVIGYSPLTVKWFNSLLAVGSILLLYDIVRRLIGCRAARWSVLLALFWPSTFLWSIVGLKEAMVTACILLTCWLIVRGQAHAVGLGLAVAVFGESTWPFALGALAASGVFLATGNSARAAWCAASGLAWGSLMFFGCMRVGIASAFGAAMVLGILLVSSWRFKRLLVIGGLLLGLFVFTQHGPQIMIKGHAVYERVVLQLVRTQLAGSRYPGTMYRLYPSRFLHVHPYYERAEPLRFRELCVAYARGAMFVIGAPFPWASVRTWWQFVMWPQMVVNYWLLAFAAVGWLHWMRIGWRETLPIAFGCAAVVTAYSLAMWNVGTLVRLRDMLTPLFLAWAATGLASLAERIGLVGPERGPDAPVAR